MVGQEVEVLIRDRVDVDSRMFLEVDVVVER